MIKTEEKPVHSMDVDGLVAKIKEGYTINRVDKHTTKKTFAPSTISSTFNAFIAFLFLFNIVCA